MSVIFILINIKVLIMKILAIVILYCPDIDDVKNNILRYIDYVDELIIWQNTQIDINKFNFTSKLEKKITFLGEDVNKGIAYPLNKAREILMNESLGFTHLLAMDQDSVWENFEIYKNIVSNNNDDNVIYSPNINEELSIIYDCSNVKTCITSGAIFPLKVLKIIGNFNENYSVDCVDYDFCFKATNNNINILKIHKAHLHQVYGVPLVSKYFNIKSDVYSHKRLFFIVRNHILLWRDFPENLDFRFVRMSLKNYVFFKIIKITLMEDDKLRKINYILKGLYAGIINNRTAKY